MTDGTLFRQLRRARHLTLQQVADAQVSAAAISRFERGQLTLTAPRFAHVLARIEVSLEEFMFLRATASGAWQAQANDHFNSQDDPHFSAVVREMGALTAQGPVAAAKIQAYDQEIARYRHPAGGGRPTRRAQFAALLIEVFQRILWMNAKEGAAAEARPSVAEFMVALNDRVRPVVRYLYQVEQWGYFELSTFAMFHTFIDNETEHALLHLAMTRSAQYAGFASVQEMRLDLLFGAFSDFVNARQLPWAKDALATAAKQITATGDLTHANHLLFCRGWVQIIEDDVAGGTQTCQQAISIERLLGVQGDHHYVDVLKLILRNRERPNEAAFFM
ncbi:helix-turn-helix domain-containing protein [Lacticaseibacillus daqingensis]|uniref:helix-turn-helix domain-containing protein n=1 Tax=Lacticaseibacillus daqingensis TaxID=2486014 RepID=UPI000F7A01A9|nr:helix-turn-helix transcriptional regulator [Lacticaseibacillus daqingensis]